MGAKTITANERLQLIGLLTLAAKHSKALDELEQAVCAITGEKARDGGHSGDAIYSPETCGDADKLLEKLDITVEG